MVHNRGENVKKGEGDPRNDNAESRDKNDRTNLSQSIRIHLFNRQVHYKVISPDDAGCNGNAPSSMELRG